MKKVVFRADSNKIVAMGHVMRCLSIADALKDLGVAVTFVCASRDPEALIESRGYEVRILDSDFSKMEEELDKFIPILEEIKPDFVFLDTYYLTVDYASKIKEYAKTVFVDDYGKDAFPVDVLINYNIYGDLIDYEKLYRDGGFETAPRLLLGPSYAPLRKAFREAEPVFIVQKPLKGQDGENEMISTKGVGGKLCAKCCNYEILLTTGGSDGLSIAKAVLDKFLSDPIENSRLNVLIGPFNKDREYIEAQEKNYPNLIRTWSDIKDMPGFLANFDLALSAAGSTSYELCCMGIPAMLFCMADNQSQINETFDKKGIYKSAGNAEKDKELVIEKMVSFAREAQGDVGYRKECAAKARALVDARGAERIAKEIINYEKDN